MKTILWDLTQRLSFRDVFLPAIAGRSAGPESIAPAVVVGVDGPLRHRFVPG
jgi:hypothetical protein